MRNGAWTTLSAVALLTSFGELARAKARRGERAALALTGVADLFAEEGSLARSWIDYSGLHKQGGPSAGLGPGHLLAAPPAGSRGATRI